MPTDLQLRGVYVPLITPFAADGSVALDAVTHLSHHYLDAGVTGLVPLGTTGEASALTGAEKRAVVDAVAQVCRERNAQLVVGAGTNSTATTVEAVRALADVPGLSATLIVVPYYVRPSEAGIVEHFRVVADASPVPVVLYNVGFRTGRQLSAAGVIEAAAHQNIVGIKQAAAGLDLDTLELLAGAPEGFAVLGGEDPFLFPVVLMGGAGAICASAHVCTERFVAMIECGLAHKVDDGRAHAEALLPVVQACFAEPNPAVFKGVLHAQGLIPTGAVRLPLTPASDGAVETALAAVRAAS
jgi:4-hydroxy-tetrahydrodipicolinate synthase